MKGLRAYLLVGGLLLVIYIVAQLYRPKAIDWTPTFSSKDKIPYGTYILAQRLKDIFPGAEIIGRQQPIYNVISDDSLSNSSYIIVCSDIRITKTDYEQLARCVRKGNDVFIAAEYFGGALNDSLKFTTKTDYKLIYKQAPVTFVNPVLNPQKQYSIDKATGNFYFEKIDTPHTIVLGQTREHKANFIKFPMGKGALFLLSDPKFFTNYSLLKPQGAQYAATALSYIKNTDHIIWDDYYTQGEEDGSPMKVFLTVPALEWAYYITLFSLLAFVLFEIKRRQRIIPVVEPLPNTTLNFINVVGQVYYEKHNNANIAHKKILYFFSWIRDNYQLSTAKTDAEFIEKLAVKSGMDQQLIKEMIGFIQYIQVQERVNDQELIRLNRLIEDFYKISA